MLTSFHGLSAPFDWRLSATKTCKMNDEIDDNLTKVHTVTDPPKLRLKNNRIAGRRHANIKNNCLPCDSLFIYKWPLYTGDFFVLQDQMAEYLRSKSFKRKYRGLQRRIVDVKEREYLKTEGAIDDEQLISSLIALKVEDVLNAISQDFPNHTEQLKLYMVEKYQLCTDSESSVEIPFEENDSVDRKIEPLEPVSGTSRNGLLQLAEQSASSFNSLLCKRRSEYNCCFDLQTMQVHFPARTQYRAPPHETAIGSYPVALIHGQYQDYYARYNSEELKYLPLKTCIYTFSTEKECSPKCDLVSSIKSEVDEITSDIDAASAVSVAEASSVSESLNDNIICNSRVCGVCSCADEQELLTCSSCMSCVHPSCVEMSKEMIEIVKTYDWQCMDCKRCSSCHDTSDEEKMMFCDLCDRGYHTFCVGLGEIPNGIWRCIECLKRVNCSPVNETPKKPPKIRRYRTKRRKHGTRGRPPKSTNNFGYGVHDFYYTSERSRRTRKSRVIKSNAEEEISIE